MNPRGWIPGLAVLAVFLTLPVSGSGAMRSNKAKISMLIFIMISIAAAGWRPAVAADEQSTSPDTTWFGHFHVEQGQYFALQGPDYRSVMWTFDRGDGPFGDPGRIEHGAGWTANTYVPAVGDGLPVPLRGGNLGSRLLDAGGSNAGIEDISACVSGADCDPENNVLELHASRCGDPEDPYHPVGQSERLESPICNVGEGWTDLFLRSTALWQEVADSAVVYRTGWRYYPLQDSTGVHWSPRVGPSGWTWVVGTACRTRFDESAIGFVPDTARQVIVVIELEHVRGYEPARFPDPFIDNLAVGVVRNPAPGGMPGGEPVHAGLDLSLAPNPSSGSVEILFHLEAPGHVRMEILDSGGRLVQGLVAGRMAAGAHRVVWNGSDRAHGRAASGVYRLRVTTPEGRAARSLVLLAGGPTE